MPDLLTEAETAEYLRVSTRTIRTWRAQGILPAVKIAGVVRYRRSAVEQLIAGAEDAHGAKTKEDGKCVNSAQ
jgi:excisionase family DNA binding protein